jgi:PASTA domain
MTPREKRVRRRVALLAALTMAALTSFGAGAQAKTATIGSPLTASFTPTEVGYCDSPPCQSMTLMPGRWSGVDPVSRVDGTVVSYRLAGADGTFAIQIIRSVLHVGLESIATSTPTHMASSGVSPSIAANLPIEAGDHVGLRMDCGDRFGLGPDSASSLTVFYPPLADGAPPQAPCSPFYWGPGELGMQATVRYCQVPRLKGKTLKAARKALKAADCTVGKVKRTDKVLDKEKVLFQSVQPFFLISDTQPIKLTVSRK